MKEQAEKAQKEAVKADTVVSGSAADTPSITKESIRIRMLLF